MSSVMEQNVTNFTISLHHKSHQPGGQLVTQSHPLQCLLTCNKNRMTWIKVQPHLAISGKEVH